MNKFKVIAMEFNTDDLGTFQINLGEQYYNIIQNETANPQFPKIIESMQDNQTMNSIFNYLHHTQHLSLNDIYSAPDSWLYGLNVFTAANETNVPVINSRIRAMVVIWSN